MSENQNSLEDLRNYVSENLDGQVLKLEGVLEFLARQEHTGIALELEVQAYRHAYNTVVALLMFTLDQLSSEEVPAE